MKNCYRLDGNILVTDAKKDIVERVISKVKAEKVHTYTDHDVENEIRSLGYEVFVIDTHGDLIATSF